MSHLSICLLYVYYYILGLDRPALKNRKIYTSFPQNRTFSKTFRTLNKTKSQKFIKMEYFKKFLDNTDLNQVAATQMTKKLKTEKTYILNSIFPS